MDWLYKYSDNVVDAVTGRPIAGAVITVTAQGAPAPTLYSDAAGLAPYPDNTVSSGELGAFEFYIAPGYYYDLTATFGTLSGSLTTIQFASLPHFSEATVRPVSASYTESDTKVLIAADTSGGDLTITFASAAIATAGAEWIIKHIGPNTVTLATEGSETIEGEASLDSITANEVIKLSAVDGNIIVTTGS